MPSSLDSSGPSRSARNLGRAAKVVVVSSVMFSFLSYWRVAAIVLCDMSSTAYYIGAIVENAIGKAAPWFILAVLCFSYGMRSVYIESCSIFVRGGVYRVVKEAMGGFLAKLSVSALLFDYVLTGPISGVSAGQYIVGLILETVTRIFDLPIDESARQSIKNFGSVGIACAVTLYFFRQNLLGMHESSGKALRIMIATTVMAMVMLVWCGVTFATKGAANDLPSWKPDLHKKVAIDNDGKVELDDNGQPIPVLNPITGRQEDPLGFLGNYPSIAEPLRNPPDWLNWIGAIGIVIAFGHAILGMSGLETLAQVYREVESPKLPNFKKAAFVVFSYSFLLTGGTNFLAVLLIPHGKRMNEYYDNWIGGLAMQMVGPVWLTLLLNGFVVFVGFLILSGAVNTSIVGSNGVLSRVAEDGVLPDWFLKPHKRYGTSYRLLLLIVVLQLVTIVLSRGNVILLGEAYAFGVVWSFVFKSMAMVVLRFKRRGPREFVVPFNIRWGAIQVPIGLSVVFVIVLLSALANLVTKPIATVSGIIFSAIFLVTFMASEAYHERQRRGAKHEHKEQFNRASVHTITAESLGLEKRYRKLVAIRSPHNLFMLEKALSDTDPDTTDVVVMTAKVEPPGGTGGGDDLDLDTYDRRLMTAVVDRAERMGKKVIPLIVPTNNPLNAVLKTAQDINAQEVMLGASNKYTAEEQLDQISLYWINLHRGQPHGLTVHLVSNDRDITFDLEGGNRIPKEAQSDARSVEELRAAGIGVRRMLLAHDGTPASNDVFEWLMTMLAPEVELDIVAVAPMMPQSPTSEDLLQKDQLRAEQLGRKVALLPQKQPNGPELVRLARDGNYNVIVLPWSEESRAFSETPAGQWINHVLHNSPCSVFLASHPVIPREVVSDT